jgi:hypothetical protein
LFSAEEDQEIEVAIYKMIDDITHRGDGSEQFALF